jgi:DNA-binding NarL/FixJ family response regulator
MITLARADDNPTERNPDAVNKVGQWTEGRSGPRILIVEDEYLIALELENRLLDAGFEVVGIAATAGEAISLAGSEKPHLAIMDIRLAGHTDGVDTAIEIFATLGIRSIFSSAHAEDAATRRRASPAAPVGWLQKPYPAKAVIEAVRNFWENDPSA